MNRQKQSFIPISTRSMTSSSRYINKQNSIMDESTVLKQLQSQMANDVDPGVDEASEEIHVSKDVVQLEAKAAPQGTKALLDFKEMAPFPEVRTKQVKVGIPKQRLNKKPKIMEV